MRKGTYLELPSDLETYRDRGAQVAGLTDERPMLLYIGQHRWEKNLRLMLESLAILKQHHPEFAMVFVGQGYAEHELHALLKTLGLTEHVTFLGVIRDREIIKQLYARAAVFLFPSEYDTSPLTLREAAAFHVPTLLVAGASATEGDYPRAEWAHFTEYSGWIRRHTRDRSFRPPDLSDSPTRSTNRYASLRIQVRIVRNDQRTPGWCWKR